MRSASVLLYSPGNLIRASKIMTLQQTSLSRAGWFSAVLFLWAVLVIGGILQTF